MIGNDRKHAPPEGMERGTITQRIADAACGVLARIHAWLGRLFRVSVALLWRVQKRVPMPLKFFSAFLLLAALMEGVVRFFPNGYLAWTEWTDDLLRLLDRSGRLADGLRVQRLARIGVAACLSAAFAAGLRRKWTPWVLKAVLALVFLVWVEAFSWSLSAPAALHAADFRMFDAASRNDLWAAAFAAGGMALLPPLGVLLLLALADTRRWYVRETGTGLSAGDRLVESLRTGGDDPRFRTSGYWSVGLFLAVIVAPFFIRGCGWEDPYGLVKGDGAPDPETVVIKRVARPEKKKLLVNAWSPYIFDRMKIDDTDVMEKLLEETLDAYAVQSDKKDEKSGKKGRKAGWPKGMEDAVVRFIRLKYSGGDWDQDMGKGADYNLLLHFNQVTGFPIAGDTEAIEVSRLRRFPADRAPPFVFLTGRGGIGLSETDIKTLRWYLEDEGGMLFIDNGGGQFDRSVRSLIARLLPGKTVVDIANDDPIYRAPYVFPNGAPPFWHHGGNRALGVKIDGRWAVFYHPGDINDAWKDGHSGAAKEVANQAYKLGVNVMYYAFNAYYARHFEQEGR
ncbi:MAG: DUF4159 domain-containing protein [Lentisphaerae bacterium]|nr:DUF4159 domain-containing protein [Lentisphaerota bacterium]